MIHKLILSELKARKEPVQVAIVGCGWVGAGVARELARLPGFRVAALVDKDMARVRKTFADIGCPVERTATAGSSSELKAARRAGKAAAFSDLALVGELRGIDVVFEAIGEVAPGLETATHALQTGMHLVTANCEMDATVGLMLARQARSCGLVYTEADGDQPAVLARMIAEVEFMGFQPKIVGNCKGFVDHAQTPSGVMPFVPAGQNPVQLCANADGSKQSFEMAILGNAFGYRPLRRGMHGPRTTKADLVRDFEKLVDISGLDGTAVDFVMGIDGVDQGGGVFVVARRDGEPARSDMLYLKKGPGPNYLFFRDHHLCYFESASSIAEAVLFRSATLAPAGRFMEVIAVAKRPIAAGQRLDGIGGYDCYGLAETAAAAAREGCLPQGLAEFATARVPIAKDAPITYEMVELDDAPAVRLKSEQDRLPLNADGVER